MPPPVNMALLEAAKRVAQSEGSIWQDGKGSSTTDNSAEGIAVSIELGMEPTSDITGLLVIKVEATIGEGRRKDSYE